MLDCIHVISLAQLTYISLSKKKITAKKKKGARKLLDTRDAEWCMQNENYN